MECSGRYYYIESLNWDKNTLATLIQKECNNNEEYATAYGPYNIETTMFVLVLITFSWLKINIKKKTENGHCRNPAHESKENKPTEYSIGSKFHKRLYDNYLKIIEEFVEASRIITFGIISFVMDESLELSFCRCSL